MSNINLRPVGKCSCCGGVVSLPTHYMSVRRPVPTCEKCGAVADEADMLPVIPTKPVRRYEQKNDWDWYPEWEPPTKYGVRDRVDLVSRPMLSHESFATLNALMGKSWTSKFERSISHA